MARYGHRAQPTGRRRRAHARASRAITTATSEDTTDDVKVLSTSLTGLDLRFPPTTSLGAQYPPNLVRRWAARTLPRKRFWPDNDSDNSEWDVIESSDYYESPHARYMRKCVVAAFLAFVRRVQRQCPGVYARCWPDEARPDDVRGIFKRKAAPMPLKLVKLFLRYLCEKRRQELEQGTKQFRFQDCTWELKQVGLTLLEWHARRTRKPTPVGHVRKIKDYAVVTLRSEYFRRLPPPRVSDDDMDPEAVFGDRLSPPPGWCDEETREREARIRANEEERQRAEAAYQRIKQERRDQGLDESNPESEECRSDGYYDLDEESDSDSDWELKY